MQNIIEVKPIATTGIDKIAIEARTLIHTNIIIIRDQSHYEICAEELRVIKTHYRDLETFRKKLTIPIDNAKKAVQELCNPIKEILEKEETIRKNAMVVFAEKQETERKKEEEKLRVEAEERERKEKGKLLQRAEKAEARGDVEKAASLEEAADNVFVPALKLAPVEKPSGISFKMRWYAVVTDKSKLPIEYLEPNMTMLDKIAASTKGILNIPGVEFRNEKIVSSRI